MTVPTCEPWEQGFKSYAGWVPTVRSHLSFSRIGATQSAVSFTMPVTSGKNRVVLVLQDRTSNDYPLWTWWAKKLDPEIQLRWFLDAQTEETWLPIVKNGEIDVERDRQGMLAGTITLIPYQEDPGLRETYDKANEDVADLLASRRNLGEGAIHHLREQCRSQIARIPYVVRLKFALMRTGECRIWYEKKVGDWEDKKHHWVAAQAYYFLKDIAHDHTHHDPSDDQITPLIAFDPASTEVGHEDEVAWRRETMWSLSREIERRNREGGLLAQRQSLGIIAYAESFQASLMSHVRDSQAEKGFRKSVEIHDFDFSCLKDSVTASIDVLSTRLSQKVQLWIAFTATFISLTALIIAFVSAHNASLPRGPNGSFAGGLRVEELNGLLPWLAANPLFFGVCAAAILILFAALILADGPAGLFNRAQRTVSQFGRAVVVSSKLNPTLHWLALLAYHAIILVILGRIAVWLLWSVVGGGAW